MPTINLKPKAEDCTALQWTGSNLAELVEFCGSLRFESGLLYVRVAQNQTETIKPGEWLVKHPSGVLERVADDAALDKHYERELPKP